jgi:PAS domain S-box-containing protein
MYLCDADRKEVRCVVSYKTPDDYTGITLKYGEGAAGIVAQTKEPLIIDDYRTWPGRAAVYDKDQPFTAVISVPMIWQNDVTGIIHVVHEVETRRFTQSDLDLLTLLASQAVIAINNARLVEQVQSHAAKLQKRVIEVEERTTELEKVNEQLKKEIEDRAQTEEALRESEEMFRLFTEQNMMGVIIIQDGLVKYVNQAASEITEYSIGEALDWKPNEFGKLFHPDDLEFVMEQAQKKQEGAKDVVTHYSYRLITKSGEVKWIDQYSKTITFEGKNADLITIIDITERVQTEEALRESEEKYKILTEESPLGLTLISEEGNYKYLNPKFVKMFGYALEDIPTGKDWLRRAYPNKEYRNQVISTWVDDLKPATTGETRPRTFIVTCRDNTEKIIYFRPVSLKNGDQLVTYEDITERKKAEEAQRKSERELSIRNEINSIFLTYPDEEMYAEILKVILKVMESEYGTFGYFDNHGSFVAPAVTRKIYWEKCNVPEKEIIFQKGTFGGIWGKAIKERKTLISNEGPFKVPEGHIPIVNTMVTPIIFRDEVISAIHIANNPDGYDEEDRTMLRTIADNIAPVLYARLQRDKLV